MRNEQLPLCQCFSGGVSQPGPGLWNAVVEQSCLQSLHAGGDGEFSLWTK